MDTVTSFDLSPVGYIHSTLKERKGAPRQGSVGLSWRDGKLSSALGSSISSGFVNAVAIYSYRLASVAGGDVQARTSTVMPYCRPGCLLAISSACSLVGESKKTMVPGLMGL